jgi:hypothetical protein
MRLLCHSAEAPAERFGGMQFALLARTSQTRGKHRKDREMDWKQEDGIIKYGIAWLLGVPVSVLVLIFLASRAC